jgi:hypothetical protein
MDERFKVDCTCIVAQRGLLCEHKLDFASGDETIFADENGKLRDLLQNISRSPLPKAVAELRRLEKERNIIVDDIRMQRLFILGLISA